MTRAFLVGALLLVLVHVPWRLAGLAAETFMLAPAATRTSTGDDAYWRAHALESRLEGLGWTVKYESTLSYGGAAAYGLTNKLDHTITIDEHLHWNARFAVLAHEGGHVLQPVWVGRAEGEVFAEAVAAILCHDGLREHARYLAPLRWEAAMLILTDWRAMYTAAAVLED